MTQAPTPGPLSAEDVKLLVKGDLLLCKTWGVVRFDRFDDSGVRAFVLDLANDQVRLMKPINMAFIGRPDADGWMPWSGGENPVPGRRVVLRLRSGITSGVLASEEAAWGRSSIIAFRLAPTAPVEASGSELNPATADLVDRFAAELKLKLAKAEAKYGYAADWLKTDWQDELNESLAEHLQKGDPRDVAAYCAFAWHHGWPTSDVAGHIAPAPRPQPSGETRALLERIAAVRARKDFTPQHANAGLLTVLDDCAAILAFGGQQEDWRCPDCGAQADEWFDCCKNPARAEAEAQDEGAAGEPPLYGAWNYLKDPEGLARIRSSLLDTQDWHHAAPINCNSLARLLDTIEALRAHPSPPPAADADGVIRVLERICETQKRLYGNGTGLHLAMLDLCIDARAEL
ncbi:MAG: hypothetical protein ACJAVC_000608, partial [Brevundimonas sp.]